MESLTRHVKGGWGVAASDLHPSEIQMGLNGPEPLVPPITEHRNPSTGEGWPLRNGHGGDTKTELSVGCLLPKRWTEKIFLESTNSNEGQGNWPGRAWEGG